MEIRDYRNDLRLKTLKKYFSDRKCPAARFSEHFLRAADSNEIDWRLLPSIAVVESSGGKAARGLNFFGWDSGNARFESVEQSINTIATSLSKSRLYRNKSVMDKLRTYNRNEEYPESVAAVMSKLTAIHLSLAAAN